MKNILLIGGSYGIGYELAKELQKDNTVFVASRTNENLDELNVTHLSFDALTDTLDISKLCKTFAVNSFRRRTRSKHDGIKIKLLEVFIMSCLNDFNKRTPLR